MSDPVKPKRPPSNSGRVRSRPPQRDPRVEPPSIAPSMSVAPHGIDQAQDGAPLRRTPSMPRVQIAPTRIAVLEGELARLGAEREAEADELARMLVRIADAERARTAAEQRTGVLSERVRELEAARDQGRQELDAARQQLRRSAEIAEMATRRAGLAERSASDGAVALERAGAELEADRARLTDLEARLARARRDHVTELAALRAAHEEATIQAASAFEQERTAAVHGRERLAAAEAELAAMHAAATEAVTLVDELERREEMTSALRARSLDQARRLLTFPSATEPMSGDARVHATAEPISRDARVTLAPAGDTDDGESATAAGLRLSARPPPHEKASLQAIALDEIDLD